MSDTPAEPEAAPRPLNPIAEGARLIGPAG